MTPLSNRIPLGKLPAMTLYVTVPEFDSATRGIFFNILSTMVSSLPAEVIHLIVIQR